MKIMSIWLAMVALIVLMVLQTGCTAYKVAQHNDRVRVARQMIEIKPEAWEGSWGAKVGIDLLSVAKESEGYIGAWKADPGGMAWSHITDAVIIGGTAYLYDRGRDEKTAISEAPPQPTYSITAGNVIIGDGNSMSFVGGE